MAQTRWSDFAAVDDDPQPIDWSEFEAVEAPPPKPAPSRGGYLTETARGLTQFVPAAVKTASVVGEKLLDRPALGFGPSGRTILRNLGVETDGVPESRPLYRAGEWMERKLEAAYPSVPEAERNLGHDVARGLGQVASMVAGGLGAKAAGATVKGAALAGTALGFSQEFDDAFQRARARGDDPDTSLAKSLGSATVSALIENKFGAGRILRKYFPDPAEAAKKLSAWGVSKATAISLAVGFGEEGSQRFAQNWIVEGKPSLEGIVEEGAPGGIVQAIAELPAHLLRGPRGRIRSSLPRPERKPDEKTTRPLIPEVAEEAAAAVRQPPPDQEVLGSQESQSQKQLGLRRVVAGDTEPKGPAAAPAQEEASLIVGKELGFTVEPAMNLEGVDPEVAAKIPPMVRFTDTRKPGESPTASLSFSVPANASREQIITEFERAKKGFVPPVIPPGNAPQGAPTVAGGPAVISGGQPPAAVATPTVEVRTQQDGYQTVEASALTLAQPAAPLRPLTEAEQSEFQTLSIKARAARETGGDALTGVELRRYQDLEKLAGAQDLPLETGKQFKPAGDLSLSGETAVEKPPEKPAAAEQDLFGTYTAKAEELAQRLEKLKRKSPGGTQMVFFPGLDPASARALWNTAIDAAQAVLRATGRIADAIDAAIQAIRQAYQGQFDEAAARVELTTELSDEPSPELPQPPQPPTSEEQVFLNAPAFQENAALADEIGIRTPAEDEEGVPTKVGDVEDMVLSRPGLNAAVREDSVANAENALRESGLNVERADDGLFRLADTFTQQEQEGQRLVTILEREIQSSRAENRPERIANLLNTVVVHLARDQNQAFSQALKNKLYSLAQGERSAFGRALGGLAMWGRVLANVAQNLDLNLGRLYSKFMGGEQITPVMEKLMTVFRSYFTPEEIQAALNPLDIPATVDRLIQLNQKDSGSRVYRQVHARLKAKVPKTQEQKNRKALEDEAIEAMIRRAAELGKVEPKKLPNQKLTPDEQLALVSQPAVAAKIQEAIEEAIRQAEFNAGWKAEENAARGNAEALADIAERKAVGEEPSEEMIEAGLQLKEYAHWNVLRDALLNYSPTTVKLVEEVITGRFSGARFKPPVAKPEDLRIDFKQLAVSPEAEVQRVFDAQLAQVSGLMQGATPETVERVTRMFQEKITQQLEQRRREVVDYMFAERATGKEKRTAIEAIKKQINAGLLRDQRLSDMELLERAAAKSTIRNLLPNSTTLINRILDSPRYKLEDIKADIAAALVQEIGLTDPQAQELSALIYKSLDGTEAKPGPLRTAARKALEKVQTELSPADKKVFFKEGKRGTKDARGIKQGRTLWDKLERAVKAGLFDSGDVLQEMAKEQGWTIPTPAQKAQLKEWVEEEIRLRTPTQRQIDKFNGDAEKATAEAEAGTEGERIALIRNIQSNWSRWSMPVSFVNWFSGNAQIARNNAKAINEFVGANLLLKFGFAVRQMMDVGVVSMPLNAINRALAHVMERAQNDGGFSAETIKDLDAATKEMVISRIASIKATLRNMERTLTGHTNRKVLDRMSHSVGVFERMTAKADELEAKGNMAGARAVRLATILQAGYRIAAVWDSAQSTGLEWQEMRQQLSTDLRKTGATRAEIATKLDDIFGGLKVDLLAATEEARLIGTERGLEKDNATLQQDAWNLIKASAYDRMRAAAGTETDYKAENEQLRELHSWNLPETGGLGGVIAETIKAVRSRTEKVGIPTGGLFSFGNAMGIAANRIVTFSGGGLFGGFGFGDSPWYQGSRNVQQRRIEAVQGLAAIGILVALAAAGKILVQIKYPEDKDEKEKFIAEGHKLNTIKFMADDGGWVEYPIQMSPFSFIAAPLYMIGGMQQLLVNQHREQERLNAEAAKTGTTPGTAKPIGAKDAVGVIAQGIYGLLTGGRTASGAVQSFSDYGDFNLNKAASRLVTPYVPGLPAWQEASRAMGVAMDTRTATMLELLVPSPWSGHQRVNSLGDPLVNPNDFSRVVQVATGGIGWGSDSDLKDSHAYQQIFAAGYSTPDVGRNKGYNFDGTLRPMSPQELETYTVTRGKNFKQELDGVDVTGLPEKEAHRVVQQAFQRANARALSEIGVYAPPRASTPRAVTPIISSVPRVRSGRVRSSLGAGRSGSSRTRLATMKVPRLKRGRVRGSMRRRGRIRNTSRRTRGPRIYA